MRIETLRLALGALRDEYSATVGNAVNAMDDALKAESRGDDEAERTMLGVSEYWDSRATQTLDAMQEIEAALDAKEEADSE